MLITENDLILLVRKILIETKLPKDGNKMFGKTYKSKSNPGNMSMTLVYYDGNNAYFLLTKNEKNKDKKLKTIKDQITKKYLKWTSKLEEYSDYSQSNFVKHLKAERIVYSPRGLDDVEEEIVLTGFDPVMAADVVYDTIVDGGAAAASLFPVTAAAASAVNLSQAVKKLIQGKVLDATISALAAIPITSAGIATLGSLAKNKATRTLLATVIKETPGMLAGLQGLYATVKKEKSELLIKLKEVTKLAKKNDSLATSMYASFLKLLEKILVDVDD